MSPDELTQWLDFGVNASGWLMALYVLYRFIDYVHKTHDKILPVITANTEAMSTFTAKLDSHLAQKGG